MKELKETIKDVFIEKKLDNIDIEIINESLSCDVLRDVAKQLLTLKQTQNTNIKRDKEAHAKETGDSYWPGLEKSNNETFREIFGYGWNTRQVKWSEIDNSCVTVYEPEDFSKKLASEVRKVLTDKKNGLFIIQNPETNVFEYVIFSFGYVIQLTGATSSKWTPNNFAGQKTGYSTGRGKWHDITIKEKIALCENKRLYYIDLTGKTDEYRKMRTERDESQRNTIPLDPYLVSDIARRNVDRYKKIVAQMKAKRENADALLDKCKIVIQKISELAIETAKDAVANADMIEPISKLTQYVYDKLEYHPGSTYRHQGYYSGVNGLLPMIAKYSEAKIKTAQGITYYQEDIDKAKKALEHSLDKIFELADKYNINLGIER